MWENVTDNFTEKQRHYKDTYLEIDNVLDGKIEVSLFSSETSPYEIYFSFGIMHGIIYTDKENANELYENIKKDIYEEYMKNNDPTDEFMVEFDKKYHVCLPSDIYFDMPIF